MNEPPFPSRKTSLAPGRVLCGAFRIRRTIALTETGTVYEATQLELNRSVAVKTLGERVLQESGARSQLSREVNEVSKLRHPHIVEVLDFGETEELVPFLVMEMLQGHTLARHLARNELMPVDEALKVGVQIASALTTAHAAHVAHGSLCPSAIFLTEGEEQPLAKLLSFGISHHNPTNQSGARSLRLGRLGSSPNDSYAPPSTKGSRSTEERIQDDQYSLAVLFHEMLTGAPPASSRAFGLFKRRDGVGRTPLSQLRLGVPPALDRVLQRALQKNRGERYPGMKEFSVEILEAGRGLLQSRKPLAYQSDLNSLSSGRASAPPLSHQRNSLGREPDDVERLLRALVAPADGNLSVSAALELVSLLVETKSPQQKQRILDHEARILNTLIASFGGEQVQGEFVRYPGPDEKASPEFVFLLSRFEGGATASQVVQASPVERLQSWAVLVELLEKGFIRLKP